MVPSVGRIIQRRGDEAEVILPIHVFGPFPDPPFTVTGHAIFPEKGFPLCDKRRGQFIVVVKRSPGFASVLADH